MVGNRTSSRYSRFAALLFQHILPLASSRLSAVGDERKKGEQEKQRGGKLVVSLARLLFVSRFLDYREPGRS